MQEVSLTYPTARNCSKHDDTITSLHEGHSTAYSSALRGNGQISAPVGHECTIAMRPNRIRISKGYELVDVHSTESLALLRSDRRACRLENTTNVLVSYFPLLCVHIVRLAALVAKGRKRFIPPCDVRPQSDFFRFPSLAVLTVFFVAKHRNAQHSNSKNRNVVLPVAERRIHLPSISLFSGPYQSLPRAYTQFC